MVITGDVQRVSLSNLIMIIIMINPFDKRSDKGRSSALAFRST